MLVCYYIEASLGTQTVKDLAAMWETRVQSLGREDHLEKGMATHHGILTWEIPWTEEPSKAAEHVLAQSQTQMSD